MEDHKQCPYCGSGNTTTKGIRKSEVTGQPIAYKYVCKDCKRIYSVRMESALTKRAEELGIDTANVTRVKYWETAKGEPRMSITEDYKDELNWDTIFTSLQSLLNELPEPPKVITKEQISENLSGADFLLVTTDRHFGMEPGDLMLYPQEYGEKQIDAQNLHMIDSVVMEAKKHGKFKSLWYVDLGDAVHGYNNKTVRGGHELNSALNTRQQFDLYVRNMWALIDTLIYYNVAEQVHILLLVNDNHSGDFGYICARAVQLLAQTHAPDVEFRIETKFMTHETIGGESYIFTHGKDKEHMKFNMPLTLNPKTETLIDKYMMYHNLPMHRTHVLKGDIHQPATTYGRSFRYKNVIPSCGKSEREDILYGNTWRGYEYEIVKDNTILQSRTVIL